jgi:LuxR family transcriptional regulator, maltose regulon positive regulatory protein
MLAKITRPALPEVVHRKRLFSLLDEGRRKHVTWISSPAGSGKTTLAASYLDSRELPCLWYRADEGDADIASFFYYMGIAAQKTAPRVRKPLPLLTPEYMHGLSAFIRNYFENLYGRLKSPCAIVFDNFQDVPEESPFHGVVTAGLALVPAGIQIIILSRKEPPAAFMRLRANNKMNLVGWNDIRFTLNESKKMVRLKNKRKPSAEITRLYEKTEGWAAGLVLLIEGAETNMEKRTLPDNFAQREIFDYFAGEILDKLEVDIRDFLLKSAFLTRFTISLAKKLTAFSNAAEILRALCRSQFFITCHAAGQAFYQYHPLFREFLLIRASEAYTPDQLKKLRKKAAELLEQYGQTEDAADLYRYAGDWVSFVGLIESQAQQLIMEGRHLTLEAWIRSVPNETLDRTPWLLYWYGTCRLPSNPKEGLRYFEKAFELFQLEGDATGTLLAWSGAVNAVLLDWDDFGPLDFLIAWLHKRTCRLAFPSLEVEAECASSMAGALVWRHPEHAGIGEWIERALNSTRKTENSALKLQAYIHASYYYFWVGDIPNALLVDKELQEMSRKPDVSPLTLITCKWLEADTSYLTSASYESGLEAVSQALEIARAYDIHLWDDMIYALGAYGALLKEDRAGASEFLDKMKSTLRPDRRHGYCHYYYMAAWHSTLFGDLSVALSNAELALKLALEIRGSGLYFPEILCRLALANILCEKRNYQAAADQLVFSDDLIQRSRSRIMEFMHRFTKARVALAQGNEDEGTEMLCSALEVGRSHNFFNMLYWWQPSVMTGLCARALESGIEADYVRRLIRTHNMEPGEGTFPEAWPWRIKIYAVGKFEIFKDGERIVFSGKVQQKPLSMLKAIIAFGGRDVSEGDLTDNLWPEADGDAASLSFRTTLHRLRQLLGYDDAVQFKEGRATLDPRYCWVDVLAFQRIAEKADRLWNEINGRGPKNGNDPMKELIGISEKAMKMYKGDFLPGDYRQHWTFSMREKLKSKFIRLVARLGTYYEQAGEWEKVIESYRNALEIDDLQEEFYRGLMNSYLKLGRHAEALAAYDRCRKMFESVLRVEPSRETEALRLEIKTVR